MILVRFVFQAKFGKAGEVAEEFKKNIEMMSKMFGPKVHGRILTDLSGPFDTVIQELEVENLAEWEKIRAAMFESEALEEVQSEIQESPFESGRTEFYPIEATF